MMIKNAEGTVVGVAPLGIDLERYYSDIGVDPETVTIELSADEARQLVRTSLYRNVADLPSLLGVTADTAAICMDALATLVAALETATTVEELRAAMAGFAPHLSAYADDLDAGTAKLPYRAKGGLDAVMPEIRDIGTRVAEVFEA